MSTSISFIFSFCSVHDIVIHERSVLRTVNSILLSSVLNLASYYYLLTLFLTVLFYVHSFAFFLSCSFFSTELSFSLRYNLQISSEPLPVIYAFVSNTQLISSVLYSQLLCALLCV